MFRSKKFNALLDRMPMPVYLLTILAAIVIVFVDRNVFYNAWERAAPSAPPAPASVSSASPAAQPSPSSVQLSIEDPSALPQKIAAGDIVPFSFVISNAGPAQKYWYKVSVTWKTGEEDVIDENILTLAADASQTIPESLKFETSPEVAQIVIQIEGTNESISFTVPRT